jgi:surface antigen
MFSKFLRTGMRIAAVAAVAWSGLAGSPALAHDHDRDWNDRNWNDHRGPDWGGRRSPEWGDRRGPDWGDRHRPPSGPPPGWHGDIHRFHERDAGYWRSGRWWQGRHDGRAGWWWIVGGTWYWYPQPVYPYPDPFRPPQAAAGPGEVWFYCPSPAGYYPYVARCFAPWRAMPAGPAAPPPVSVLPEPAPQPGNGNALGGTVLGAIGGGLLGAQIGHGSGNLAAVAAGTLLGAFLGREMGSSLDRSDALAAEEASRAAYAAPLGQGVTWNNPRNGHTGTIVPAREGQDTSGNYCREFQQTIQVGGRSEQAYGRACRQPDGAWQVVGD